MAEYRVRAGAGKAEISFAQEDFPLKAFTGIHDRIHVRVLILRAGASAVFVSVELTSLPEEAVRRFRQECSRVAGIEEEGVFVSVTHTFSAPHIPPEIKNEQEQRLSDILYDRIGEAIRQASGEAREAMRPAEVEYCEAPCCLNINRNIATPQGWWTGRNEGAFSDHTLRVLRFRHEDNVFAYVVNYDLQSSVMNQSKAASGGRLISGDLVGAACRRLEQEHEAVAIFLPGCAGDQAPVLQAVQTNEDGTVHDLHEDGFVLAEQMGRYLAERVDAAEKTQKAEGSECLEDMELQIISGMAELPEQVMKYPTKELRPQRQYFFDLTGRSIPAQITILCLGEIRMLLTAPELNSGFGMKVREILGENLLIVTLINGAVKYLPEAEDFERITYAAMNTKLGPGSAERFLETVSGLKSRLECFRSGREKGEA